MSDETIKIVLYLEGLAIKAIEGDMEALGEYGEMWPHFSFWKLPKDFEQTPNMKRASKLYLDNKEEANKAYWG